MTCQLLPWVLASLLSTMLREFRRRGRRPATCGSRRLPARSRWPGSRERNAESTAELTRSDRFRALEHRTPGDPRLRCADSGHPEGRTVLLQFLAGREEPAGPLASHHAGGISKKTKPDWEIVLDLDALGKAEEENWVWHGAQPLQPGLQGRPRLAVCAAGPTRAVVREFDLDDQVVREGRLHAPRGQEPDLLARCRQRLRGHRLRPGLDDRFGLSTDRQGMEARDSARRGRPSSSKAGPRIWASSALRDLTPGFERDIIVRTPDVLDVRDASSGATGSSSRSRSQTTPASACTANGCCCTCAPTGRSAARRIRPAASIAADLEAFLKGTAPSTCSSSRPNGRSLAGLQHDAASHHPATSWTTSAAASTS